MAKPILLTTPILIQLCFQSFKSEKYKENNLSILF